MKSSTIFYVLLLLSTGYACANIFEGIGNVVESTGQLAKDVVTLPAEAFTPGEGHAATTGYQANRPAGYEATIGYQVDQPMGHEAAIGYQVEQPIDSSYEATVGYQVEE